MKYTKIHHTEGLTHHKSLPTTIVGNVYAELHI